MFQANSKIERFFLAPTVALLMAVVFSACPTNGEPKLLAPDLFDQALVQISVTYESGSQGDQGEKAEERDGRYGDGKAQVSWEPKEAVTIYFIPKNEREYHAPKQVRWVVDGLRKGHSVRITAKEGSRAKLFRGLQRDSNADNECDSILSGRVDQRVFELADADDGKKDGRASWRYNIEVYDAQGERIGGYDPEIIIKRHP